MLLADDDLNISSTSDNLVDTVLPGGSTPILPAIESVVECTVVRIIRQLIRNTVYNLQGLNMIKHHTTDAEFTCTCNCKSYILNGLICSHSLAILDIKKHYPLCNLSTPLTIVQT